MSEDTRYFLPEALIEALAGNCGKRIVAVAATLEKDGFKIPGFVLEGAPKNLKRFIAQARVTSGALPLPAKDRLQLVAEGAVNGVTHSILSVKSTVVHCVDQGIRIPPGSVLDGAVHKTLDDLSAWTGLEIWITAPDERVLPPMPFTSFSGRGIRVAFAVPPGDFDVRVGDRICGVAVSRNENKYKVMTPTKGYASVIVKDEDNQPVAQIIDRTIYLFLPIAPEFDWAYLTSGTDLLRHVMRLAWNAHKDAPALPEHTLIEDSDTYVSVLEKRADARPHLYRELCDDYDRKLKVLENEWQTLLRERRVTRCAYESAIRTRDAADRGAWRSEWDRIKQSPYTAHVSCVEEGIQIETVPIVSAPVNGVRYRFGSFVIRIDEEGEVYLWALTPLGPEHLAHPHIGATGHPCLGNIGLAVRTAAFEQRIADVYELVVNWLVEGYEETLAAEHKITEWPVALETEGVAHEQGA